jgi:site-specific DNA-methyltransferase (adenine-specific)
MKPNLLLGDCAEKMRTLADNSIDAIVTDPPYGLAFMGANWDYGVPGEMFWREALRVAKPGAHLLAFGGTRTYHRLACAIEDAGWEIRDCIMWVYGSGFPKSMDVSKAIDKMLGAERTEVIGSRHRNVKPYDDGNGWNANNTTGDYQYMAPATPEAAAWQGWGTCLKPAVEPIVVARKPLEGTVAANVLKYGTGAINIDACRVPTEEVIETNGNRGSAKIYGKYNGMASRQSEGQKLGRFPANLIHDGSDEVLALFPDTGKSTGGRTIKRSGGGNVGSGKASEASWTNDDPGFGDSGSAARFFYCAKASRSERNKNCERLLQWEQDQELTQLIEKSSQLLMAISESMMQTLDALVCNMTSFGNDTTVQSQSECKSIISTALKLITELKTSLSSQPSNTSDAILDAIKTSEESGINVAQLAEKLNLLKLDSTNGQTDIAINAVNALFDVLSEIRGRAKQGNHHVTIKPIALMRYLVRLVTRKGGIVLDPFMGSGTTGVAAIQEGMNFVGIERDPHYYEIASRRISAAKPEPPTPTQQELPL